MIIIKNLFRIILILVLFTIIAQSKESDKINKNEWVISLEQYFLNLGNIEGSFTQIDQIGNITKGIFYSNGNGSLRFEYFSPCLLYTSPSPRDYAASRMPSSA